MDHSNFLQENHVGIDHFKDNLSKCMMQSRGKDPYLAWNKKVPDSNMQKFQKYVEEKRGQRFASYWELHSWSMKNTEEFWAEVWNYFDIISSKGYEKVLVQTGPGFLDNQWFVGARLNFSENLLRIRDDRIALTYLDEMGNFEEVTFRQLFEEVRKYAAAFRKLGVQKGDMFGCHTPNRTEVVFALLACASIGATFSAIQPYYGAKASGKIAERMEPKYFLTTDQFQRDGIVTNVLDKLPTILANVPSVLKVIVVPTRPETLTANLTHIRNCCLLPDILDDAKLPNGTYPPLEFEQLPFDHPLFLNFTSGTTGLPKGPVHGAGSLIPLLVDVSLHWNLKPGDTIFSQISAGWAVYNWFLPCLMQGVRLVLHNRSCTYVRDEVNFWHLVDRHGATWVFLEPGMLDAMEKMDIIPGPQTSLDSLRMVCICGSPVKVQNVKFVLNKVKAETFVGSLYGSTESYGCYSGFDLNLPLYAGEIQAPALGKDMKCLDKNGHPLEGQLGELVIFGRSPSYPLYLWKDTDGSVMNKTYLNMYPGAWCPSDEAWVNPNTRGIIIVGRSDDILIQHGDIFGSADVYFAIHDMEEVSDYICVSQEKLEGDVRAVLFVKLKKGHPLTPELTEKICQKIHNELWEECVPDVVLDVPDIPYNINGKRMEGTVRKIVATNQIPKVLNIRNPECLKYFSDRPEILIYQQES